MKTKISLFDWNGTTLKDISKDGRKFNLTFKHIKKEDSMGFLVFEVEGDRNNFKGWLVLRRKAMAGSY